MLTLVEQDLLTPPEHLRKSSIFNLLCSVWYIYADHCSFSFGHCIVCPSSNYVFFLPLWYFQTLSVNICIFICSSFRSLDFYQNVNHSSTTSYGWIIALPVLIRPTFTNYPFAIFNLLSVNINIFYLFCSIEFHQNVNHGSTTSYGWIILLPIPIRLTYSN